MTELRHHLDGSLTLGAVRIYASDMMATDPVEDWSRVRSPSRAARRRRQGHPQRIVIRREPRREILYVEAQNAMFMHPVVLAEFAAALERRAATDEFWTAVRSAFLEVGCRQAAATIRGRR